MRSGSKGEIATYGARTIERGFTREAKRQLDKLRLDSDEIVRLRVGAKSRLYAVRGLDGVFDLLWWDPYHEVYPTERRRT